MSTKSKNSSKNSLSGDENRINNNNDDLVHNQNEELNFDEDAPKPRLCHLKKWPHFNGYGFNLHAERAKSGQHIGKVDPDSPAESAGLREHDRIIEVNYVNISNENHQQVVKRIRNGLERDGTVHEDEVVLLVVDKEADDYYKKLNVVVKSDFNNVFRQKTKERLSEIQQPAVELDKHHSVDKNNNTNGTTTKTTLSDKTNNEENKLASNSSTSIAKSFDTESNKSNQSKSQVKETSFNSDNQSNGSKTNTPLVQTKEKQTPTPTQKQSAPSTPNSIKSLNNSSVNNSNSNHNHNNSNGNGNGNHSNSNSNGHSSNNVDIYLRINNQENILHESELLTESNKFSNSNYMSCSNEINSLFKEKGIKALCHMLQTNSSTKRSNTNSTSSSNESIIINNSNKFNETQIYNNQDYGHHHHHHHHNNNHRQFFKLPALFFNKNFHLHKPSNASAKSLNSAEIENGEYIYSLSASRSPKILNNSKYDDETKKSSPPPRPPAPPNKPPRYNLDDDTPNQYGSKKGSFSSIIRPEQQKLEKFLEMSAAEFKNYLKSKGRNDPRIAPVDIKQKFQIFQDM